MEGRLWELLIPFWSVNKHGHNRQFLFLIGRFLKQLFLWNHLVRSIYGRSTIENAHFILIHWPSWLPQAILVLDWSISETALPKWTDIWWEAPIEGSILSFLKAEWKVSDWVRAVVNPTTCTIWQPLYTRGSAHWACVAHLSFCFEET